MQWAASVVTMQAVTGPAQRAGMNRGGVVFDDFPLWARPAARVGIGGLATALFFFGLAGLLAIFFPSVAALANGAITLALVAIGGIGFAVMVISATILAYQAIKRGVM